MKNTGQIINLHAIVPDELAGSRLDQALVQLFPNFSRAKLQTWVRGQQIKVNDQPKRPRDKVQGGEVITLNATLADQTIWQPQALDLNLVYEDADLLVVNKPVGLVVHPAAGNLDSTLVNAILHHAPQVSKLPRAGIVHRLDKNTSGLLVVAKTLPAYTDLIKQLQARSIEREYAAIVNGVLISGGSVEAPIARNPMHRKQMAVVESGKPALTHYRVVERFRGHTLLKVMLATGRTHQIRVHMAYIGHAITGDATYGGRLQIPKGASEELISVLRGFKHQALHAKRLALLHPVTKQELKWIAPLRDDFQQLLEILRHDAEST